MEKEPRSSTILESSQQMSSLCRRSSDCKLYNNTATANPKPLTVLLVVQVPQYTKMHLTHHIHLHIPTHNHQPAISTVSLLYMCKHQPLTLTLHNFNLTYTKLLPNHLHKITKALTITQTKNKYTHHQHNHLMHSFHNLSIPMFHHRIFHNIHLLTAHLHIVPTLRSC